MYKKYLAKISIAILVLGLFVYFRPVQATVLLTDDFTGTTIDTAKWNETDAGGVGGTSGNIQQNGSLSMTGAGTWGANYVVTDTTYDRSLSGLEMEADVTCTAGSSIMGIGYGDPGVLTGGGESYTMYVVSNTIYFSRQSANSNAENFSNLGTCTNNVSFHIRITIGTTTGASLYINGSGTPAATATGGTFNNKGFFLSGHSGSATLVDNFAVNGTGAATEPDAPTSLVATPASTQMGLTWSAPSSNGGSAITDYLVEYKLNSEPTTWTTFSDGVSTSTYATVTGLTNGLSYNFRVSAINGVGTSTPSSTATATPALSVPSAPQSLAATSGTSTQSVLTWSAPITDGGASITDYIVEYKLNSEPTTWTTFADGTSTSTGATVTGLTNGLLYNFRVSAVNSVGTGAASSTANATPNTYAMTDDFTGTTINTNKWTESDAGGLGGTTGNVTQNGSLSITPTTASWASQNGVYTTNTYDRTNGDVSMEFSVTRSSCGSGTGPVAAGYGDLNFTVSGSASYIFLSNSTGWEIYYWLNGSNQASSPQTLSGITSCTNGVPTTFRIVAKQSGGVDIYANGAGSPNATIAGGTFTDKPFWFGGLNAAGTVTYDDVYIIEPVTGPFAPTGLGATAGDGQASLSWTSGGDNGAAITDYVVQYKLSTAGSWTTFSDGASTSTSAIVTGLTNGALYNFRVSAVNTNGTSDPSTTANATPVSATPTAPVASSVSITGSASLGELLTGTYTYTDANGNAEATSTYRWLRADSAGGSYTAIPGATSINYTVTSDDLTKYLKFEVTPVSSISPTTGTPVLSSATAQVTEIDYINQILSTGQSLSVGVASTPALTTTQPYSNLMLTGGAGGLGTGASFTPLVESSVETISSSMANTITANDPGNDFDVAVSLHGVSGYTYSQLKKGTGPYSTGMTQVTNAKSAATALGRTSRVIGVTTIHGETDNYNGVSGATYQGYLEEWQSDYETDAKAITGQTGTIPLFLDQMSSFMSSYANDATSEIPIYQLYAAEDNPGKIVLVAPKYYFNYSDRHHLTGASSRWLGEYYGKVIKKVVIDHESWRPLSPDSAVRSGNIIYANFHVPAGSLTFDTTLVSARTNYGFEYYDSTSSATISSVEILDSDTVKVTLSGTPTGANQRLRYAYTGVPGTNTGAQNAGSAAGNLRDSDPYPSLYGNTLYNWAVHFDEPITLDSTAPTITSVSSSKANGTYGPGEVIDVDVTFSEPVTSTGNVTVTLETGSTDRTCTFTVTNSDTGTCDYTVQAGDTSSDLTVNSISGTIADLGGNAMSSFSIGTNLAANKAVVLKTTPPTITSVSSDKANGTYAAGEVIDIDVTFSEAVTTTGNLTVTLETGTVDRTCTFSVLNSTTGTCNYTVQGGDTSSDLTVSSISGTVEDQYNNEMVSFTPATNLAANKALVIDTTNSVISLVTSTPSNTSAVVTWTTDEDSSSIVDYGLTSSYGSSTSEADTSPRVTSHSVSVSPLLACTTYHYRVRSKDAGLNQTTGSDNTLTTTGCTGSAEVIAQGTETIPDATGGTASLTSGGATLDLEIPSGAAGADAEFQIKQLDTSDAINVIGSPNGFSPIDGYSYELKALSGVGTSVTSFNSALTITMSYQDGDLGGIDEATLVIYHYSGGVWSALTPCTVDTLANTVTCETDSFSFFGLFGASVASAGGSSGSIARHAVGTNIVTTDGTIYTLTADGKRRPYTSAGAYLSYGFNTWNNVVKARSADLTLPVGDFIPPRDGSITCSDRGADKGTCYLITGGKKAGFTSATVFKALGFSFANSHYGDVSFMESAPNISTSQQAHHLGTLINNAGTLQLIGSSALVGIPSMSILTSWGYNPATAVLANSYDKLLTQVKVLSQRLAGVLQFE